MASPQTSRSANSQWRLSLSAARSKLDYATLLGIVSGFALLGLAMFLGGSARAFLDLPAVLIVLGGTLGVTTICFSLRDMATLPGIVFSALFHSLPDPAKTALHMLRLAELARSRGILGLDQVLDDMEYEPFLNKAVAMAVDGIPVDEIRNVLQRDIDQTAERNMRGAGILRKAAELAPAMGLIGTLIGLVQMLGNLDDPSAIGPGLAVALLTTFYGAVLANMVFAPLSAKLERNAVEEVLISNIYMLSAESVCRKENPRRLEMLLNTMLSPAQRVQHFS